MTFSNSYIPLGEVFYQTIPPKPVRDPKLFLWNDSLAAELELPNKLDLSGENRALLFSGNDLLPNIKPIALAYAGHQFGNFVPQLGDGRAHLLGETMDSLGEIKDIQLKGSGQTSFSRNGDGRCALGPAIREFIMSEAMHALGVPSSRSLAVVTTGEKVFRETTQPGAVVTRVASSHLRVGSFEYFAARENHEALETLANYAINRHYPEIEESGPERYLLLLEKVIQRQIELVTEWLRVGFIHGVMNTDNTAISGETIDFGPCAMLGIYHPETVFSSIDQLGRYSFGNQPTIAQWNMARFAETLLPLIDSDQQQAIDAASSRIADFANQFQKSYLQMMTDKLGLTEASIQDDKLILNLLNHMEQQQLDYTITFDRLTNSLSSESDEQTIIEELSDWYPQWRQRLENQPNRIEGAQEQMRRANPLVIPRNYHMENVIRTCVESGKADAAEEFFEVLSSPYTKTDKTWLFQDVPEDADEGYQTFCGT
jgi:uncharacterized protein YdiU (UPF0061 family)